MPKAEVLVIGSVNTDLVVKAPKLPTPGETVVGGDLEIYAGGKGANQAVAAARAGAVVRFCGAIGDDEFSSARRADLDNAGVDTSHLKTVHGHPGGTALILLGEHAENMIVVAPGANTCLAAEDVDDAFDAFPGAGIVLAQLEAPLGAVLAAAERCAKEGREFLLNPAPCPAEPLPKRLLETAAALTPNRTEFEGIGGPVFPENPTQADLEKARRFVESNGYKAVVVSLGASGALLLRNGKQPLLLSAPSVHPVDTVGAGDCLNGVMAAMLGEGRGLEEAVEFAVMAASIAVTRPGAQAGMPARKEIEDFIRNG